MLTARGWWFFLVAVGTLAMGLLGNVGRPHFAHLPNTSLSLIGLTLLLWFGWEWGLFALRVRLVGPHVLVVRELRDDRGAVDTLWAGRKFHVRLRLSLPDGVLGLPFVTAAELGPFGVQCDVGERTYEGPLDAAASVELTYRIQCPATGRLRFEGLTWQVADLHGFFYHAGFLAAPAVYRVLPPLTDVEGHAATVKRQNLLPPPGIHRFPRPGSGSELLDLRDYLPGDPPRTIAWKVSARRDRLITKEFESEVPVRCTLFVDTSNSVRLGPPGQNPLTRLVEIAAAVAQAAAGARDLTGLCLFDEKDASYVRPARSARHLARLLNLLADAAGLAPTTGRAPVGQLLPLAYRFAQKVYPHLLRRDLNRVPFWLPWLWPQPAYTVPDPTWGDRAYQRFKAILVAYAVIGAGVLWISFVGFAWWLAYLWLVTWPGLPGWLMYAVLALIGIGLAALYVRAPSVWFFPQRRRLYRWRKQMAAILSVRYGLAPGGLGTLLEDNEQFSLYLQRFLADHHVPYSLPLFDRRGRYLFTSAGKVAVLARALLRAVARGRDNELFVLLADFLELGDESEPVLKAIKVALGRHHRVMVVCPWPAEMPPPGRDEGRRRQVEMIVNPAGTPAGGDAPRAAAVNDKKRRTTERYHRDFHRLRRQLGALGVPVVCARGGDPTRLILDRLDQLRGAGRNR